MRICIREAKIPLDERDIFERYGEQVIGLVLAGGFTPAAQHDLKPVYDPGAVQVHARDWLTGRGIGLRPCPLCRAEREAAKESEREAERQTKAAEAREAVGGGYGFGDIFGRHTPSLPALPSARVIEGEWRELPPSSEAAEPTKAESATAKGRVIVPPERYRFIRGVAEKQCARSKFSGQRWNAKDSALLARFHGRTTHWQEAEIEELIESIGDLMLPTAPTSSCR